MTEPLNLCIMVGSGQGGCVDGRRPGLGQAAWLCPDFISWSGEEWNPCHHGLGCLLGGREETVCEQTPSLLP